MTEPRSLFDDADAIAGTLSLRALRPDEAEEAVNAILAASSRGRALEQALSEIARAGVMFDARGTHSQRVVDIAREALRGT